MAAPILPVAGMAAPASIIPAAATPSGPGTFRDALASAIEGVEGDTRNASASIGRFLSGEGEELHTTVMAAQRAALSFDLFLQIRSKVVSAYQEIMRMQI